MQRQTKDLQGYYIDAGVHTSPSTSGTRKDQPKKSIYFEETEDFSRHRRKKQQMSKTVNTNWYKRYATILPEGERISVQPRREIKKEIVRISSNGQELTSTDTKVEYMQTRLAEERALKVDAVLRILDKKSTSKLLDKLGITNKRSSMVLDAPIQKEAPKRRRTLMRLTNRPPIKSKWLIVKNNRIIRKKIQGLAQSIKIEQIRLRWKKATRTVLATIRFGAILHDIARTTASVFHAYDTLKDGLSEHINAFDKSKFKSSIPKRSIDESSKWTLRSEASIRTDSEVHQAMLNLRRLRCFCAFPAFIQLIMAKIGQYIQIAPDRVILREGQPPQCFYILISGKVVTTKLVGSPEYYKFGGFEVVNTISSDNMFGTDGMFGLDYREQTATSVESCEILSIAIDDYHRLTLQCEPRQNPEHIRFVSQLDFMRYFPLRELMKDADNGNIIIFYFAPEQLVTSDICESKYIFIVKTGSCNVLVESPVSSGTKKVTKTLIFWRPPEESLITDEDGDLLTDLKDGNDNHNEETSSEMIKSSSEPITPSANTRFSFDLPPIKRRRKTIHAASLSRRRMSPCSHLTPIGPLSMQHSEGGLENNFPTLMSHPSLPLLTVKELEESEKLHVNVQLEYNKQRKKTMMGELIADDQVSQIRRSTTQGEWMNKIQRASCWEKIITVPSHSAAARQTMWVFLKELRETDIIGLECMDWGDPKKSSKIAVVSGGSVVVAIKKSFLLKNADARMRAHIRNSSYIFPTAGQVHFELKRQQYWRRFQHKVMCEPNHCRKGVPE